MHACIIDPSKTYLHVLGLQFRKRGFECTTFTTGAAALESIDTDQVDLICVAFLLEDMGGIEFCEALRERGVRGIPIIMVTSEEDDTLQLSGMRSGITEIFGKTNLSDLQSYLEDFARQNQSARELSGRVLYIEDSRSAAFVTMRLLKKLGLTVEHFTQAQPALEAFAENDYDLVLTDVVLEGSMSGLGLTREIRRRSDVRQRIPILAMSGMEDTARKVELLRSGVNDYIAKPVIEEELAARVRNLIENKKLLDQVESQQQRLEEMAMTDQLTGLLNRRYLREVIDRRISESTRHQTPLSVVVMDIDHFKRFNDTHGHATGDVVLAEAAHLLKDSCRREDFAVRFGGEEFVLVMPHCRGEDANKRADVLRQTLEAARPAGLQVTASFGVTELPLDRTVDFDALFDQADQALYAAKEGGRNRVVFMPLTAQSAESEPGH